MPLVLRLKSGQDFFVKGVQIVVDKLHGDAKFDLKVPSTGRVYSIDEDAATEMREVEDVFLSSGGRVQAGIAKVMIDAPRSIDIQRGENVRGHK
jgi:hypothetical protein